MGQSILAIVQECGLDRLFVGRWPIMWIGCTIMWASDVSCYPRIWFHFGLVCGPMRYCLWSTTPTDKAPPAPYKVPGTDNLNTITK